MFRSETKMVFLCLCIYIFIFSNYGRFSPSAAELLDVRANFRLRQMTPRAKLSLFVCLTFATRYRELDLTPTRYFPGFFFVCSLEAQLFQFFFSTCVAARFAKVCALHFHNSSQANLQLFYKASTVLRLIGNNRQTLRQ